MHTKNDILQNTLEQMLADCEDNGRDGIQPMLTPEDVSMILKGLRCLEPVTEGKVSGETAVNSPFSDTVDGMLSADYKERFKAEYQQTRIRYERLKAFNNRIEASFVTGGNVANPPHECPDDLLREQQNVMGRYLHILEVRAVIEGVDL